MALFISVMRCLLDESLYIRLLLCEPFLAPTVSERHPLTYQTVTVEEHLPETVKRGRLGFVENHPVVIAHCILSYDPSVILFILDALDT